MATLENEAVRELKSKVSGQVLLPSEPGYDEARTVWNAMIDRRPAVIVRRVSAQDVIHAVRTAREQKLVLAVRGGGHNIAGNASATTQFVLNVHGRAGGKIRPRMPSASPGRASFFKLRRLSRPVEPT
jgi:hypothetical protein